MNVGLLRCKVKLPPYRTELHRRSIGPIYGGGERDRTDDLLRARQALSQLSYTPDERSQMVGLDGVEPSTSRLSGVRSNQTELQAPASARLNATTNAVYIHNF